MEREEVILKLKEIVISSMNLKKTPEELSNENLVLDLGLNSIDALEILVWIENNFEIEIADEDLNSELLQSFDHLADYIISRKAS